MMRTSYDPEGDAFYARLAPDGDEVADTKEVAPCVVRDLDAAGQRVGIDVLSVAARGSGAYGAKLSEAS